MTNRLLAGPIGIALGLVYGFIFGLLVCKALPSEKSVRLSRKTQLTLVISKHFTQKTMEN